MIRYKRSLFLHIPKTGGTWVRKVLLDSGGKKFSYDHNCPDNVRWKIDFFRLGTFCFVRHPLGFVHSIWKHWSGNPNCRRNNSNPKLKLKWWDKKEFADFYCSAIVEGDFARTVHNFQTLQPGFVSQLYQHYTCGAAFVGRHENLRSDLIKALTQINGAIPQELEQRIDKSKKQNVSEGVRGEIPEHLALEFSASEPACIEYAYDTLPGDINYT